VRGGFEHPRVEVRAKALGADLYRSRGAVYARVDLTSRVVTICRRNEPLNLEDVLDSAGVRSLSKAHRFDDGLHRLPGQPWVPSNTSPAVVVVAWPSAPDHVIYREIRRCC
jgi:hypothetical protein